jgi:hypothetical protein
MTMTMTSERATEVITEAKRRMAGTRGLWQDEVKRVLTTEEEHEVNRVWGEISLGNRSSSFISALLAIESITYR